ncbi:two-component regulator propeller domain-containing protein [Candidatus Marithioploca araucensis]|uniref:Two-component regulator propeller domain-containing protein n=1 Tax=Candidatus Marithioploca araucensis TaxID=70273 RepID=A0ABT7VQ22_9GAMM|nr:two-component regulator propeller domain-containing protein [Candidatus Marithioploca araucensis]
MFISRKMKLLYVMIFLLIAFQLRAEITFTPDKPVVEMEEKITLSVSGTVGELIWSAQKGWIEGTGTTVTYIAPSQPGLDVVTVVDAEVNIANVAIQINGKPKKRDFSPENAVWEVFTNRDHVKAFALSKDKATLWLGTTGGLEKRKTSTGELDKVYINTDGLPNNNVKALLSDEQGGVWVGTWGGGLAHLKADGSWQVFNEENSNLPYNAVFALLSDEQGGFLVGTSRGGLAHFKADGSWQVFNKDNSNLPNNEVNALLSDEKGGFWIGTGTGLAHLKADGYWQVFNEDNSSLPDNLVNALLSDEQGGVWIGTGKINTDDGGLAHLKADGYWQVFNEDNSNLPDNNIWTLLSDEQGGIWVGTSRGLAHLKADDSWQVFKTDNSNLPSTMVDALLPDAKGGIWIGTYDGFAHLKADGSWQVFNEDNSNLHSNLVNALLLDDQGGVWVGTSQGLAHLTADGSWQIFNEENSNLSSYYMVQTLLSDAQGGVWVGTWIGGLAHLTADGSWQIFNEENSKLPSNHVNALLLDEQGGVWIGTDTGIAHLKADDSWQVFNTDNSNLPYNEVNTLLSDEQGGVWVGTGELDTDDGGLAHLKADGSWQVFKTDNSKLPDNWVLALLSDEQEGIWVGTDGGIANLKEADGSWQVFNEENSNLPRNNVQALLSDGQGGVWVGTWIGGLAHLTADGSWQIFNEENSNLPGKLVNALLSDEQGGVWIGTLSGGIAHLTFGEQQSGKRAAIIIAGGGNQASNSLWDTTESISTYFYKMLNNRKFVNSEIYYLSSHPWADFNGDGFDDKIVDAPRPARSITLDDVKKAFEWAKEQGKLDQPLYVFFIDHGGEGKLQLAKNTNMSAEEFKGILDDYQQATGNQVVLLLEACYSGSHLPILKAPNRAIISSAKENELAWFEEKKGFSHFFTKNLLKGMNFLEAFEYSVQQQGSLLAKMDERLSGGSAEYVATTQTPQCDDNGDGISNTSDGQWLKQLKINGDIQTGDFTLAVESLTVSSSLQVGKPFSLSAKASTASGQVRRVWAVIRPPRINLVLDSNGTPILAYPTQELSQTEEADIWVGTWNQAVYNGDYEISFYTKDNEGNIEMSEKSVVISVNGGIEPPASASVDVVIEKDQYARGEPFKFEFVEQLGWGYDLYVAVMLPDGQFITLEGPNEFAKLNQPEKWNKTLKYNEKIKAIELTLPSELPTGKYCLYGILSPERENVVETLALDLWVMEQRCFEVF